VLDVLLLSSYVANYNATMEKFADAQAKGDTATMIALQPAINFNGGGHVNHRSIYFIATTGCTSHVHLLPSYLPSIFWTNLAPPSKGGGGAPSGDLAAMIDAEFGSFEVMAIDRSL
jgi:Fe-Mn family superoxide dismutase